MRAAREVIGELEREWADEVGDKRFAAMLADLTALHDVLGRQT